MNGSLIPVVEQYVVARLRSQQSFTALDISNALKADAFGVTHDGVAEIVRDIYRSGAMAYYDFGRRLIDVMTHGGTKKTCAFLYLHTCAFLYLHNGAREKEYTSRTQDSLPPVPPEQARPLLVAPSTAVSAATAKRMPSPSTGGGGSGKRTCRQDGAFAVPRQALTLLGWRAGDCLALDTQPGRIILQTSQDTTASGTRVWKGHRLRICRRKMRMAHLTSGDVSLAVGRGCLTLTART